VHSELKRDGRDSKNNEAQRAYENAEAGYGENVMHSELIRFLFPGLRIIDSWKVKYFY